MARLSACADDFRRLMQRLIRRGLWEAFQTGACEQRSVESACGRGRRIVAAGWACVSSCQLLQLFVHRGGALGCASGPNRVTLLVWVFTPLPARCCKCLAGHQGMLRWVACSTAVVAQSELRVAVCSAMERRGCVRRSVCTWKTATALF